MIFFTHILDILGIDPVPCLIVTIITVAISLITILSGNLLPGAHIAWLRRCGLLIAVLGAALFAHPVILPKQMCAM
jgi:hypothetical protein